MTTQYATPDPAMTMPPRTPTSEDAAAAWDPSRAGGMLQTRYLQAVMASRDTGSVISAVGQIVAGASGSELLTYYARDEANRLIPRVLAAHEKSPLYDPLKQPLYPCAADACASGSPRSVWVGDDRDSAIIAVPVQFRGRAPEAIVAVYRSANSRVEALTCALQLAAVHLTLWQALEDGRRAEAEAASTAALHELLAGVESSRQIAGACQWLVDKLRQHLDCDYVALGWCSGEGSRCRLQAISGVQQLDKHAPLTLALEAALQESIINDSPTYWPPPLGGDRGNALAHHKLSSAANVGWVMTSPLRQEGGKLIGAWAFLAKQETSAQPHRQNFICASEARVASCLGLLQRASRGPLGRLWEGMQGGSRRVRYGAVLALLAASSLCLLAPLPYRIRCDCSLEPVARRFVAAPYDGILEKAFACPGDTVRQGDLLARMDGRELRMELAGVIAQRDRAAKQQDAAFARHDFASAELAKLEVQRLDLNAQILQRRQENLDVRSPIDGIVTAGDLDKVEGAPVTRGQSLFEVAPLDTMIVELALPEEEIEHARKGMEGVVRLDSYPDSTWRATISKIHPRAEIRNHRNIFVAEVTLDNPDGRLRPGMLGQAKLIGQQRAWGWILLHKPWHWLSSQIGW